MKHLYLTLVSCMWVCGNVFAQQESTLSTMRSLPQATYTNPAFVPAQTFYLGLPGISSVAAHASSNSISVKDITDENSSDDISASYARLKSTLKEKNWVYAGAQVDLLAAGLRVNPRLFLRYRFSLQNYNRLLIPGNLLKLADSEFAQQANNTNIVFAEHSMLYFENSLGASYVVNPKLTVGLAIKRINGVANIHTENAELNLSSLPNEQMLQLEGGLLLRTSGENILDEDESSEDTETQIRKKLGENGGFGVDLGATYQLTNKLQLGLSILNIGGITWSSDAREHSVGRASFKFEPLDPTDLDGENPQVEALIDSIDSNFKTEEKAIGSYRTGLPKRMYLNATYQLHRSTHASAIVFTEAFKGRVMPGFTAAIHKDFGRRLGAAVSYTIINGTYTNVGAGLSFRLTPFQLYVVTDNVLAGFNPENTQQANIRLGLNLVFGTVKKPSKLPY